MSADKKFVRDSANINVIKYVIQSNIAKNVLLHAEVSDSPTSDKGAYELNIFASLERYSYRHLILKATFGGRETSKVQIEEYVDEIVKSEMKDANGFIKYIKYIVGCIRRFDENDYDILVKEGLVQDIDLWTDFAGEIKKCESNICVVKYDVYGEKAADSVNFYAEISEDATFPTMGSYDLCFYLTVNQLPTRRFLFGSGVGSAEMSMDDVKRNLDMHVRAQIEEGLDFAIRSMLKHSKVLMRVSEVAKVL